MNKQTRTNIVMEEQIKVANKAIKELLESASELSERQIKNLQYIDAYLKDQENQNKELVINNFEDNLPNSNEDFKYIFENSDIGNSITLPSGEVNVNRAFCEMLGYTKNELNSLKWQDFTHPEDIEYTQKMIDLLISGDKERMRFSKRFIHKDGSVVWAELGSAMRRDKDGNPLYLMTNINNITKRVKAEQELKDSREQYRNLIELAVDGVLLGTSEGVIIDANSYICNMFGRKREEIIGRHISDSIFSADSLKETPLRFDRLKNGEIVVNERVIIRPDGTEITIEMRSKMMPDGTFQSIYRDISNRIKDQQQLKDLNENLEKIVDERTVELNTAYSALQQSRINYETFFNSINEFLFVIDENGIIVYTNERVVSRLAYSQTELVGRSIYSLYNPDYLEGTVLNIDELLEYFNCGSSSLLYARSGLTIDVETKVSFGVWNNKEVIFIVTKDISEIKLSEEKFSTVFNVNPSACGLTDLETGIYYEVNEAFYNLLGYTKEEVLGKTVVELGIMRVENRNEILQNTGINSKVKNAEAELIAKDGSIKHVLLSSEIIVLQDRKYRFTSVYDITDRVQAERLLKDIIDKNPLSIQIIDMAGYTVLVNPAHTKLFGSVPPPDYCVFEDLTFRESGYDQFFERIKKGEVVYFPEHYYNAHDVYPDKPNAPCWVKTVFFPLKDALGMPERLVIIHEDVTEQRKSNLAMLDSEKKYRTLFENVHDVFYKVSLDGTILEISPSVEKMGNYSCEELIGTSVFDIYYYPEDRERILKALSEEHEVIDYEISLKSKSGEQRITSINASLLFDNKGNQVYIIGAIRDITERKMTEEKLRESQAKYQFIVENTNDILWTMNPDFTFDYVSPTVEKFLGYTVDEHLNQALSDYLTPESAKYVVDEFQIGMIHLHKKDFDQLRDSADIEVEFIRKDKTTGFANINLYITRDEDYNIIKIRGITSDITQRKQSENALRESEATLKISQQIAHIGSWQLNDKTRELKWSDEAFRIFGYEPSEIEPTMDVFLQSIHPSEKETFQKIILEAWESRRLFNIDHSIILPDGSVHIVHERAEIIYNDNCQPIKWMGTVQDITERKMAEEKLLNLTVEVEERERNRIASELHDGLGPLLSTIKIYFQWLAETHDRIKADMIIERGNHNIDEAIKTTREISQGLSLQYLMKTGFVEALISFTQIINDTRKIEIVFAYNSKERFHHKIESALYRITTELINNTLKHAQATRVEIDFSFGNTKNSILFNYQDNGIGFDAENFETHNKGLGLSNIKQRIAGLRGDIKIVSGVGKGTKINIYVPTNEKSDTFDVKLNL